MQTNNVTVIEPLGYRGEALLKANMAHGEVVSVKLKGVFGEGFVVTDRCVYVLKYGFMAGRTFGGQCSAYGFNQITGLEIRKTVLTGVLEVLTAADRNTAGKTFWGRGSDSSIKADNTITFSLISQGTTFQKGVCLARETIRGALGTSSAHGAGHQSAADEIEKLSMLRDKGIVTEEEFQAKKRQLLGL